MFLYFTTIMLLYTTFEILTLKTSDFSVKKIARRGKGRNREPVHRLCRKISSVDRALDSIVGGGGFDSRGRTDTRALEVTDK